MPTAVELVAGVLGIVLGAAWIVWLTRMKQLQMRFLYFNMSDADTEQTDTEVLVGRVTGAVLALLGVVLVLGLIP